MKKFGIWLLVLLAVGGAGSAVYYFVKPASPNVSLEFSKPDNIFIGQPFTLIVSYSNSSDQVLKSAKFSLLLPPEISFLGKPVDQRGLDESLGDIGPGSVNQETINLIALSGAQSFKRIEAKLGYNLASSANVSFETVRSVDLPLSQPIVGLAVATPPGATSGENFDLSVKYQNNTDADIKNLKLKLSYPPVFNFIKSNMEGGVNNQEWAIPILAKRQAGELLITGNLLGADLSRYDFAAAISAEYMGQTYVVDTQNSQTAISPSPLSLSIKLNGINPGDYIARPGDALNYEINFKNNSPVPLADLKLGVSLSGDMFDFSALDTDGLFNSLANTVTWTQQNAQSLAILGPGENKMLKFRIKLKSGYPIRRMGDKNYVLKVDLQLESPTVPPGVAAQKTVSLYESQTKVMGQVAVGASGFFYDAQSGILNKGPYPPQANKKTQYTIHWEITNYSTDAASATVSAVVSPGVSFTGQTKSTAASQPIFNSTTGMITWSVGGIPATKGVISEPVAAVFQLEATPSTLDVGANNLPLLSETRVDAVDTFTSQTLSAVSGAVGTSLPDDTKIDQRLDRRVLP